MTIRPASFISFATLAIRRMFSIRSASLKLRSRQSPIRTLSPSSSMVWRSSANSLFSRALDRVDLPDPDSPVIHTVMAFCVFWLSRRLLVISVSCQVRLFPRSRVSMMVPQALVILLTRSVRIRDPISRLFSKRSKTILLPVEISQTAISFLKSSSVWTSAPELTSILQRIFMTVAGTCWVPILSQKLRPATREWSSIQSRWMTKSEPTSRELSISSTHPREVSISRSRVIVTAWPCELSGTWKSQAPIRSA